MKEKILKKLKSLEKEFPEIDFNYKVDFGLRSKRVMGFYLFSRYNKDILSFNPKKAKKVGWKMYSEVIRHELAHLITRNMYGYGVRVHGKEWRVVAKALGSIKPRATIDFSDYSESFTTEFKMKCKCKNHYYSANKRTRLRNGTKYRCDDCGKKIKEV